MPLRVNHIYVSNDDVKDDAGSLTYVMPKNVLKSFIVNADLRTQVAAYLYGSSPADNKRVKEIKAVVWVPQRGSNNTVELPTRLPESDFLLKELEPLGWIKTQVSTLTQSVVHPLPHVELNSSLLCYEPQAQELNHLAPQDVAAQAKIMAGNPSWGPNSICITAAFTPGSISLSAFELSVAGFEWGRKIQDVMANPVVSRIDWN